MMDGPAELSNGTAIDSTRWPPFWRLQALCWCAWVVARYLWIVLTAADGAPWSGYLLLLVDKLVRASMGFAASAVLFRLYIALWPRRLSLLKLGLVGMAASFALGTTWAFGANVLFERPLRWQLVLEVAYKCTIALGAWSAVYFAYLYRRDFEMETERTLRARALAAQAQLNMLRYQVNPHFLFNALNSVRALIGENPEAGREMVTRLAEFFRYSLLDVHGPNTSLGEELKAIRDYLAIQKVRFEEGLEIVFDIDADAERALLPGFLVQPLVENAIKYGFQTSPVPLRIAISARKEGSTLRVDVTNTGRWLPKSDGVPDALAGPLEPGTGTGLRNVRERLQHAFPGRHRFTVGDEDGHVRAVLVVELEPDPRRQESP